MSNVEGMNMSIRDILKNFINMMKEDFFGASEPEEEVKLPKELQAVVNKWDKKGYELIESSGKEQKKSLRSNVQVSKAPQIKGDKLHTTDGITKMQEGKEHE